VPSIPYTTDIDIPPDSCNLDQSSGAALPTLTEVIFRPHSVYYYSFTIVIRDSYNGQGVSFGQLVRLIASISYMGKIADFTIKPIEQHSFFLTGFSRHTSSRLSSSGTILPTTAEADPILDDAPLTILEHSRAVNTGALASQGSGPFTSVNESGLSNSDLDPSSNDNRCSSEDEQSRSSTSKQSRWSSLDEQRLRAYKIEDKSWDWIFGKFPGRTHAAIRTRWTMVQRRAK
jgi:hypothetical protein